MRATRSASRNRRRQRVRRKISGTSQRPRFSVFRSNRYIYAQLIDDVEGRTIAAASSQEADLRGSSLTVETAAEVGALLGQQIGRAHV